MFFVKHNYAQTNIQLYDQLQIEEYPLGDIEKTQEAYRLATQLFGGCFRPNEKPFISHLVGTASILAALRVDIAVVNAGLLHAAYTHARFLDPRHGVTASKRSKVLAVVGEEVEELIYRYAVSDWNLDTLEAISERISLMDPVPQDVIKIRLANELEDNLDLGLLYGGKIKRYARHEKGTAILRELANQIGCRNLAMEIAEVFEITEKAEVPVSLISKERTSYCLDTPLLWRLSHRVKRFVVSLRQRI